MSEKGTTKLTTILLAVLLCVSAWGILGDSIDVPMFASDTNGIYNLSPDYIRRLCKSGEVCKVIGHVWTSEPFVVDHYPECTAAHRKCGICGKVETFEGRWK